MPLWMKFATYGSAFATGHEWLDFGWWGFIWGVGTYVGAILQVSAKRQIQDWRDLNAAEFQSENIGVAATAIRIALIGVVFFALGWVFK